MSYKIIARAKLISSTGERLFGSVRTEDGERFIFQNDSSKADVYFEITKSEKGNWYQSSGSNLKFLQEMIEEVGEQVDAALKSNV